MEGEEGGGGGKRERGEGVWVLEQSLHSHTGAEPQVEVGRVSGSGQLAGQILFLHINRKWKPEIMKAVKCKPSAQIQCMLQQTAQMMQALLV